MSFENLSMSDSENFDVIRRFIELSKRGYQVHVSFSGDVIECTCIVGGDCNCPCPKYFDPSDGHGRTFVHMDDIPEDVLDELDDGRDSQAYSIGLFDWMEKYVLSVEAKSR